MISEFDELVSTESSWNKESNENQNQVIQNYNQRDILFSKSVKIRTEIG